MAGTPTHTRSSPRGVAVRVSLTTLLTIVLAEGALHLWPRLLPAWYRDGFPAHGVELFRPGALAETPLEAIPLPLHYEGLDGPPPADLIEKGMVSPDVDDDRVRFPHVRTPIDERGLPNEEVLERAELVLVGDSFLVAAATVEPPGLSRLLSERLEKSVYNLGLAGIGPHREAWLVREVGLSLEPELVLWFFFGGNDLVDARVLRGRMEYARTYADLEEYVAPPTLRLPAFLAAWRAHRRPPRAQRGPIDGLALPRPGGGTHPIWFLPSYLHMLSPPADRMTAEPEWAETCALLASTRDSVVEAGARFGLVFLPSKAQVYLPHVERDPARVKEMLSYDGAVLERPAEKLLDQLLERRGDLEGLLRGFAEQEEIPFFSATPHLDALAEAGELGYLTADTHWSTRGQTAILEPLVAFFDELLGQ